MPIQLDQVEFANEAFYLAFESKDYDAMAHLWCETGEPVCLHPGWPALIGRQAVLDSWRNILSNPAQGQVSCFGATVCLIDESSAAVVCYESMGEQTMVAMNVFRQEEGRPRLYLHQAGFCAHPPEGGEG